MNDLDEIEDEPSYLVEFGETWLTIGIMGLALAITQPPLAVLAGIAVSSAITLRSTAHRPYLISLLLGLVLASYLGVTP